MSFWHSEVGPVSGSPEDAYIKPRSENIPDGTMSLVRLESAVNDDFQGTKTIKLEWIIESEPYRNKHVFQKLKVYDPEPKVRHKALNLLKLCFDMFHVKQLNPEASPTDQDLAQMVNKHAGIKIQEWHMQKGDGSMGSGNWVSEIHSAQGFVPVVGKHKEAPLVPPKAYNKQAEQLLNGLDDDIPF